MTSVADLHMPNKVAVLSHKIAALEREMRNLHTLLA